MAWLIKFPFTNLHEINLDWIIEEVKKCYSPDNPPDNVVLSVNGATGNVTLYPDAAINFPAVNDTSWQLSREANETLTGIKINKTAPLQRINGANRYAIYDQGNPPPYPVTSVNGATGNVLIQVAFDDLSASEISFITAAPGHSWALNRATVDGDISIKFDTTNDTPKAYLEYLSEDETITESIQLLTTNDIPSSAGVVSVNGESGVVVLTADEIHRTGSNNETVEHAINGLVTDTQNISTKIGTTTLPTAAQTLTGAIAEHETDITNLNNGKASGVTLSVVGGSSKTVTLSNNFRGTFLIGSAYTSNSGIVNIYCSGAGEANYNILAGATGVTFTASNNTIEIAPTNGINATLIIHTGTATIS